MEQRKKTITVQALIEAAANAAARKVIQLQTESSEQDYYLATERMLRIYPKLRQLATNPEEYGFFREERSHDISIAAPRGSLPVDKIELQEAYAEARQRSLTQTLSRFTELDAVVKLFENREDFIIIRMYYFNEDETGADRGQDAKPYTFSEISDALSFTGIMWSEKVCRYRRANMVKEMSVILFGPYAALSIDGDTSKQKGRRCKKQDEQDPWEGEK